MKYISADKLIAEIERLKEETAIGICEYDKGEENGRMEVLTSLQSTIASLQQEQPDSCIFGNTPSESSCKFCGVECALREPKQTGTTSAGLSSKDEAKCGHLY